MTRLLAPHRLALAVITSPALVAALPAASGAAEDMPMRFSGPVPSGRFLLLRGRHALERTPGVGEL